MKRVQLIEWGIVTVGLVAGFRFINSVFSMLTQLVHWFKGKNWMFRDMMVEELIMSILYFTVFILMLRNARKIASWIEPNEKSETLNIKIGKRSLLQVILIGICLINIFANLGNILLYFFLAYKSEMKRVDDIFSSRDTWDALIAFIQILLSIFILFYSKNISHWFLKKDLADDLVFDTNSKAD